MLLQDNVPAQTANTTKKWTEFLVAKKEGFAKQLVGALNFPMFKMHALFLSTFFSL